MRGFHTFPTAAALAAAVLLAASPWPAPSQEAIELAIVDVKAVAKGYRTGELTGDDVVNDKKERIGTIDDFIVGHEDRAVFAVIEVGDFLGLGGHLVAVPFQSLKLDDPAGKIVLPGATREAIEKLPVFEYSG